jgi:hypothetical protein
LTFSALISDNINKYCACERGLVFQPARWKAYLRDLQSKDNEDGGGNDNPIYSIFHSQMLWFTREESNGHQKAAEAHLKQCDVSLEESNRVITALEDERRNKPRPGDIIDWSSLW